MDSKHKTQNINNLTVYSIGRQLKLYGFLNKLIKTGLTLLFLSILGVPTFSQTPEIMDLPNSNGSGYNGGGSFNGDMLIVDDKIFVYASDGISVYDESNTNDFVGKVSFNEELGKFNPVFFYPNFAVPDQQIMTSTSIDSYHYVFTITPKMQLMIIRTDDLTKNWTVNLEAKDQNDVIKNLNEYIYSQSGRVIIKYDDNNSHNRLYVLVGGRDPGNNPSTGCFHTQLSIFGLYDVSFATNHDNAPTFNRLYSEVNYGEYQYYPYQVNNYIINENNDRYYLIRLGYDDEFSNPYAIFEERDVNNTSAIATTNMENQNVEGYHKMGKVLYLNNFSTNLERIAIFPYKYFQGVNTAPKLFIANIVNGSYTTMDEISLPTNRILDAVYLENQQDLVVCYAADENDITMTGFDNTNIAVYHYTDPGTGFEFVLDNTNLYTHDGSIVTSDLDINYPLSFTKIDGSSAYVNKKDGIDKLTLQGSSYLFETKINAESNFFNKGIIAGTNAYFLNLVSNGITKYTNGIINEIKTGYSVYHISANPDGTSKAFFNRLESFNTGFYYTTDGASFHNVNDDLLTNNDINTAIGDIVYNPFQDHFLVSQSNINEAKIKILKASNFDDPDSNGNSAIDLNLNTSGFQYATRMFVSPDGYLYVWANMNKRPTEDPPLPEVYPELFVYDASDYTKISSFTINADPNSSYQKDYSGYQTHFCYNYHTKEVYTTIAIQENKLMPYNTENSSIYNTDKNPGTPPGKLVILSTSTPEEIVLSQNPGKVIFPGNASNYLSSQYYGSVFIIGDKLYEYDYINEELKNSINSHKFENIDYNARHDQVFAVKEASTLEHRKIEVWTVSYENNETQIQQYNTDFLNVLDGQSASLFSNQFDGRTYLYKKIDAAKLGDEPITLYSFDPSDEIPIWQSQSLGMASYFPEYDHTYDNSEFYFHNYTTPYIDPYNSEIFIPNGAHSCVSKVGFIPNDQLVLDAGVNWISIPRLVEQNGTPTVDNVLLGNIVPGDYKLQSTLKHLDGQTQSLITRTYNNSNWQNFGDGIQSSKGYKIDLYWWDVNNDPYQQEATLNMHGTILSPYSAMNLYENKENWIGYFIPEEQDVLEALKDYEGDIYEIKHQNYYCYWGDGTIAPFGSQPPTPEDDWHCDQVVHNIKYGDMLVIRPKINMPQFQWNYSGNPPQPGTLEQTEYFEYTETADYTPFIIELDSTENPIEMGAFVNDSCIGACTLEAEDSLVIIKGYIGDNAGDSVIFEEYFGTKLSHNNRISEYYVLNEKYNIHEKRTIKTNENKPRYFISFNTNKIVTAKTEELSFKLFPNPAQDEVNMVYSTDAESNVSISVFDNFGRYISSLFNNNQKIGNHVFTWNLQANGQKLIPGIYLIRLTINKKTMNKKLIVL